MFSVAVLRTGYMENKSYFNCGRQAAQFHAVVIVVSPLNTLDQIDAKKKHKNVSRETYSFLEVKLRQSEEKQDKDKYDIHATYCACKQF